MTDFQTTDASVLLITLRRWFDNATALLASACAKDGRLDATRLDTEQLASYELAWAAADLLAAETLLRNANPAFGELDNRLALTFITDAIKSTCARLEFLYLELGLNTDELIEFLAHPALTGLLRSFTSGAALAETGRLVGASDHELAEIDLTHDQIIVRDQFRRLAEEVVKPAAEQIHRNDLTVPESVLQPLRDIGVFGLSIPERFGGTGPDNHDDNITMIVVTEALSEASLAAAGSLITRPEILSRALLTGGTEAQQLHWLPRIAIGEPLCGIAITEPDYGSDVANLVLRGTRVAGGWQLTGAKTWCTFAGKAGLLMVVTRTDPDRALGHRGLSVMLVEKPIYEGHEFAYVQPGGGRLTGRAIPTIGYRGMHSFDLAFDELYVPDENVLGGEAGLGKGFYFTMAGMTGGRMQTAARASGVMRAAVRAAIRYAGDRKVFGAPLLDYPLTQAKLARMAARFAACRQLTYATGRSLDEGGNPMQASLVKLLACRSAEWVTREALQIHGGMGYAEETAVSRYFVDARVLSIFEGAEETLALKVIARSLLESALAASTAQTA